MLDGELRKLDGELRKLDGELRNPTTPPPSNALPRPPPITLSSERGQEGWPVERDGQRGMAKEG